MADEIIITGREAASIVVDTSGIPAIVADFPVEQNLVVETVYVQGIPGNGGGAASVLIIDASDDEGVTLTIAEGSNLTATEDAEGVTLTTTD